MTSQIMTAVSRQILWKQNGEMVLVCYHNDTGEMTSCVRHKKFTLKLISQSLETGKDKNKICPIDR